MFKNITLFVYFVAASFTIFAQNPIIQTIYTADPAPMIHNDTLFLFTGHDEDSATSKSFVMKDYLCFSTTDMVNWTQHGPVFSTASLGWAASNNANASQAIYRNGKFYYYISPWSALPDAGDCIAVGVSASPYGPYKDAIGKPLIAPGQTKSSKHAWEDIDPTVIIDDNGQAYLYWGNNSLYCVKLNEDMISYSGDIIAFDVKDQSAFGPDYEEAPWIFKRNDTYYLLYAAHIPEAIYYATSASPTGPWKYGGVVMNALAQGSIGNHPGIIQYKGNWYLFYMNQDLPNGHDKRRAVNVVPFEFNPDGSIPTISHAKSGVLKAVKQVDPYRRTEAETMAWGEGVETALDKTSGVYVCDIDNGDYIKVRDVEFGSGASSLNVNVSSKGVGGYIEVHLDNLTGTLLGVSKIKNTGGLGHWAMQSCKVKQVSGVHDLYFVFKGGEGDLFNFNWWKFNKK